MGWEGWDRAKERAKDDPERYRDMRDRLHRLRRILGATQGEFADIIGASKVSVARWETCVGLYPRPRFVERIEKLESHFGASNVRRSDRRVRDGVDPK
jgi:transcriptional regulator with XRE-family HTH domain